MFNVSSISVHTGFALASTMASTVATNVKDWVITSSPGPCQMLLCYSNAAVPEVTARAYLDLNFFCKILLKTLTLKMPFLCLSKPILKQRFVFLKDLRNLLKFFIIEYFVTWHFIILN